MEKKNSPDRPVTLLAFRYEKLKGSYDKLFFTISIAAQR